MSEELKSLRGRIDQIDEQLIDLITKRAECAREVGRVKAEAGDTQYYRPAREAEVLRRVKERNPGVLADDDMARLVREIMSSCLALEKPLRVAYLGPTGTYTEAATYKQFGHAVDAAPMAAIDEIFREVESGAAEYGVVPVENSTEGVVTHTLDMFMRSSLNICGEVDLRIHHCLLSNADNLSDVDTIYSHQQSFAQCREWLNANLSGVDRILVASNARAAEMAAQYKNAAAIAGEVAGEHYKLTALVKNIEDESENTTRFLVIGKDNVESTGNDKTSLIISARNQPGALFGLLEPFSRHGVSMTRIESRPSRKGTWDYVFFVDIEGHKDDEIVGAALAEIESRAAMFRILGSFPGKVI